MLLLILFLHDWLSGRVWAFAIGVQQHYNLTTCLVIATPADAVWLMSEASPCNGRISVYNNLSMNLSSALHLHFPLNKSIYPSSQRFDTGELILITVHSSVKIDNSSEDASYLFIWRTLSWR